MISIGVIGATGYAGYETVRLLLGHSEFTITTLISKSFAGKKMSDVYPNLAGICDLELEELDYDKILKKASCFIVALPHGTSQDVIATLFIAGKKIVDLSADYRYKNQSIYESTYDVPHKHESILKKAIYGLPELFKEDLTNCQLVSNPGCYPTCSLLGLAPLIKNNLIDLSSIIIDAVSGVTGAGRKQDLMYQFNECTENFLAYKVATHRHTTEIEEKISLLACEDIKVTFTPHLVPMKRGMMATIYSSLLKPITAEALYKVYNNYYKNEYFVRIKELGQMVNTKQVVGSNFTDISVHVDERTKRVIVISAIDNIGKGASSQAIQNLNLMYGFDEKKGISHAGSYL